MRRFFAPKGASTVTSAGMKKSNDEEELTPEESARADEYLSQLANSVLNKERFPYKSRVQGKDRQVYVPGDTPNPAPMRPSGDSVQRPSGETPRASNDAFPRPPSSSSGQIPLPPSRTPIPVQRQGGAGVSPLAPPSRTPLPVKRTPLPVPPATTPPPVSARMTPMPASTPTPVGARVNDTREGSLVGADGTFAVGTILYFEDKSIGIYKDKRTDKDYEVIYLMLPDGRVTPQGIALENYDLKVIGYLPPEFMMRIQRRQRWDRDEIIYHLSNFDFCKMIPYPTTQDIEFGTPRPVQSKAPEEPRKLVTGRKFSINFGEREWTAVYWGEDELGPVVAHHTHDRWMLMHLDLNRFKDSLVLLEMADPALIKKIRDDISAR